MTSDLPKDISILYRKMCVMLNIQFEQIDLSTSKAMFLICLDQWEALTQADLCRKLDLDKGAVAKMISKLEKCGFVTKHTNPADVRSYIVRLTDKAKELIPKIESIQQAWVDTLTDHLTDIERDAFIQLFHKATERAASICDGGYRR